MIYDIIGDIHGQADKLIGLLEQLGYQNNGKYFSPPENHRAMFIGDLVDRGEQEVKTLEIVFAMIDADVADCIMGNHEYNALAFATLNQTTNDGSYLRPHKPSNVKQHEAFMAEIPFGSEKHKYWLSRFYELPLWIETEHACFVHACWDKDSMMILEPYLNDDNTLTPSGLQATGQKRSEAYEALERVLKGVEAPLPRDVYILDKSGTKRYKVRVKWWLNNLRNRQVHEIARVPSSDIEFLANLPSKQAKVSIDYALKTKKPVFIGHYWLTGTPDILSNQVVCTDYSAGIDSGYLTCYQFDTDNPLPLLAENFIQFNHHE